MDGTLPERRLSKSRYLHGLQCLKQLWWRVHEPDAYELVPSLETRARFTEGHRVGELARRRFPGGIMITTAPHDDLAARVEATRHALAAGAPVLYEASFFAANTYVAVDVLERLERGFVLIEVKSSTEVRGEHLEDVAVQTLVLRQSGVDITRMEVMHLDPACTHPHLDRLFTRVDVTEPVEELLGRLPATLERQLQALDGPLPAIAIGPHCSRPHLCPFRSRCWHGLPRHHVTTFHGIGARAFELIANGYSTVDQVPDDVDLGPIPARQRRAVRSGRLVVEPGLAAAFASFEPPFAYLDFETVAPAIPLSSGCHPYELVPAQFGCRREGGGGYAASDSIAAEGVDPRPECAARVVEACQGAKTVFAYHAEFEARALRTLEIAVPALAAPLAELRGRLRDPLPLLREHVYHPDFMGSFSLKSVAPALAPEIRYGGLAGGGVASVLLTRLVLEGRPDDLFERAQVRESLRSYCALDVLATQRVVERLRELASVTAARSPTTEENVTDCLFCRIASGDLPATKVGETEKVVAFRDVNPQAPTHVLLIPKQHVADSAATLDGAHAEMLAELFALAARIATAEGLTGGWRLVTNVGRGAGQSVFHFHVHLLGGRPLGWPPG